jgi:hypothetical protein
MKPQFMHAYIHKPDYAPCSAALDTVQTKNKQGLWAEGC